MFVYVYVDRLPIHTHAIQFQMVPLFSTCDPNFGLSYLVFCFKTYMNFKWLIHLGSFS